MLYRMGRETLGEFEQLVLLAIIHLARDDGDVYGVPIVDEIERRAKRRHVSRAAVYITLRRLEQKGLLAAWMGNPTDARGGKARRCVRITPAGIETLKQSRLVIDRMWKGLDPRLDRIR
jgi:PadR family transcriptional regulator, regulatory protein PadR